MRNHPKCACDVFGWFSFVVFYWLALLLATPTTLWIDAVDWTIMRRRRRMLNLHSPQYWSGWRAHLTLSYVNTHSSRIIRIFTFSREESPGTSHDSSRILFVFQERGLKNCQEFKHVIEFNQFLWSILKTGSSNHENRTTPLQLDETPNAFSKLNNWTKASTFSKCFIRAWYGKLGRIQRFNQLWKTIVINQQNWTWKSNHLV